MSQPLSETAAQLLELHVQHELAALQGDRLKTFVEGEVDALLSLADHVTLADVVTVEQINGVIRRQVVETDLRGGIAEMAGEMASEVVNAPVQATTTFGEILGRDQAAAFVEEFLELRDHREKLISEVMAHPVYQELVSTVVYHAIVDYVYEDNFLSRKVPGVGAMMKYGKQAANRAVPGIDEAFERQLKAYLNKSLPMLLRRSESFLHKALSDDELRDTIMASWRGIEDRPLKELQQGLGDIELHEFVALGYDFWLNFRQTEYFEGCYRAVVAHLFRLYGDVPLLGMLTELGVSRDDILVEIQTFAGPTLDLLRREGYLEALLRRRLRPFYESQAVAEILG